MSYEHLTMSERSVIFYMQMVGRSQAQIAGGLGRARGTISRELRRNLSAAGQYLPDGADIRARARQRSKAHCRVTGDGRLMAHVAECLERRWSPQEIAGRLREVGREECSGKKISHQTIYRWIWSDLPAGRQVLSGRSGSGRSFGLRARLGENPMESPPDVVRYPTVSSSTSARRSSRGGPAWATGKATRWSAKATGGTW